MFALGFAPGFAFMGLVEPALAAPRLSTPRKRIAERQTAVYPAVSPDGWNLREGIGGLEGTGKPLQQGDQLT